jgi:MFS family permease
MQSATIQKTAPGRRVTWLAFLLYGLFNFMLTGLGAATERLRHDLGLSRGVVGLHAACLAAGLVLGGLAGHRLSRGAGRGATAVVAAAGMAAGTALLAAGRAPAVTLTGALLMGAAGSLLLIVVPAFLADRFGAAAGGVLARANAAASLCGAAAPFLVGAAVAAGLGWRAALATGCAALLAAALAFWRSLRDRRPAAAGAPVRGDRPEVAAGSGERLPAAYWTWWAMLVLVVSVEFSFVFWTAEELRVTAGAGPAVAAAAVAVFELALAGGRVAGGALLRRVPGLTLLRAELAVTVLGFALFWSVRTLWAGLAGLAVAGLGVAMLYPVSLTGAIATAPGRSDLASGRSALGSGVAIGAAPFVLGWLADALGVHLAYLVVPLLCAGALGASALAARRGTGRLVNTGPMTEMTGCDS